MTERASDELAEMLAALPDDLTYGHDRGADLEPSYTSAKTSDLRSIITELQELRAKVLAYETAKLPCSVTLPPATVISSGCLLTTLIVGLEHRGMTKIASSLTGDKP